MMGMLLLAPSVVMKAASPGATRGTEKARDRERERRLKIDQRGEDREKGKLKERKIAHWGSHKETALDKGEREDPMPQAPHAAERDRAKARGELRL